MRPIEVKTGLDQHGPPEHLANLRLCELGRSQATATQCLTVTDLRSDALEIDSIWGLAAAKRLRPIDQVLEAVGDDRKTAPISVRVSLGDGVGQRVGRGQKDGR